MRMRARGRTAALGLAVVLTATAAAVLARTGVAIADRLAAGEQDPRKLIEATHLPPLLTVPGEPITLRYDVYCAPPGDDPESGAACEASGTVYVRPGGGGPFRPLQLQLDPSAAQGRYAATVPAGLTSDPRGFAYYAVLRSNTSGATVALPAAGPFAPQRSRPLDATATLSLGAHAFGAQRAATARVASAAWGDGSAEVGLEQGPESQPIGGSSFDVDPGGSVSVLDEAHRRVLRFSPGHETPQSIAVNVRGTIADLAVGKDGAMAVLETVGDDGGTPLLRSFDATGRTLGSWHIAERGASAVAMGPDGPVVLEYPAAQWMPVTQRGAGLSAAQQLARGRTGRWLGNGDELVVEREGNELRVAQAGPSGVRRSWRITSETALGEVQLAKELGGAVVVVVRVYADARDEFEVLVLDDRGVSGRFAVDSTAWAETAPLARFRLQGSSLYELGSTGAGLYVDRYDLEVAR